jgi:hypothetical protein
MVLVVLIAFGLALFRTTPPMPQLAFRELVVHIPDPSGAEPRTISCLLDLADDGDGERFWRLIDWARSLPADLEVRRPLWIGTAGTPHYCRFGTPQCSCRRVSRGVARLYEDAAQRWSGWWREIWGARRGSPTVELATRAPRSREVGW